MRKQAGESRYGFNEDDELIEKTIDELIAAAEAKDHKKLMQSIVALIHCCMAKEPEEDHAVNS